jgi:HAD superfamily hydrolase (TIGR01459 family)
MSRPRLNIMPRAIQSARNGGPMLRPGSGMMATTDARLPPIVPGVSRLLGHYRAVIVDLWGVIHDGERAYPGALEALMGLRSRGMEVCLLSNSPRRAADAAALLAGMGIDTSVYDHLVTSGEATVEALRHPIDPWHAALGRRYISLGPAAKAGLLDELDRVAVTTVECADFVLNTGTDGRADIDADKPLLACCAAQELPMICANPDLTVMVGAKMVACAGALAAHYETLGGDVRYHGKPYPRIYQDCFGRLGVSRSEVLAIGDALRTDIAGANAAGIDSVLVAGGIHRHELEADGATAPEQDRLAELLGSSSHVPTYVMSRLLW